MKKLLTFLFILGGLAFAQTAFAQTPTDGSKTKKARKLVTDSLNSTQKSGGTVAPPAPGSGGGITIDESGVPRPKNKKKSASSTGSGAPEPSPKKEVEEAAKKESLPSIDNIIVPSEIAIDEGGTAKPTKAKPAGIDVTNPPKLDSTIIGPALDIFKPR